MRSHLCTSQAAVFVLQLEILDGGVHLALRIEFATDWDLIAFCFSFSAPQFKVCGAWAVHSGFTQMVKYEAVHATTTHFYRLLHTAVTFDTSAPRPQMSIDWSTLSSVSRRSSTSSPCGSVIEVGPGASVFGLHISYDWGKDGPFEAPPAIHLVGGEPRVTNVKLTGPWVGISSIGNSNAGRCGAWQRFVIHRCHAPRVVLDAFFS